MQSTRSERERQIISSDNRGRPGQDKIQVDGCSSRFTAGLSSYWLMLGSAAQIKAGRMGGGGDIKRPDGGCLCAQGGTERRGRMNARPLSCALRYADFFLKLEPNNTIEIELNFF